MKLSKELEKTRKLLGDAEREKDHFVKIKKFRMGIDDLKDFLEEYEDQKDLKEWVERAITSNVRSILTHIGEYVDSGEEIKDDTWVDYILLVIVENAKYSQPIIDNDPNLKRKIGKFVDFYLQDIQEAFARLEKKRRRERP
jgi:hypothetical protein